MTWLTKTEFLQLRTVAQRLVNELNSGKWSIPAGSRPATSALKSARLKNVSVSFGAVFGSFNDLSKISANSNIEIIVPTSRYSASVAAIDLPVIRRMIYSVLVHECVHVAQRRVARAQFAEAVKLERTMSAIPAPSINDRFELYVGQPLEQEARAHQAVAEIFDDIGAGASRADFDAAWSTTQLCIRTESLIGPRASATRIVGAWWATTQALAWDIYQTL